MAAPLYIEARIHGSIDDLWRRTQIPASHARWDLRFSQITYLPRPDLSAPQRFGYTTRIGFGLAIGGAGETVGDRAEVHGRRTSALIFWSDDPKSLIRRGSGYWKYIPTDNGVRFVTAYDYEVRWGAVGRAFDRLVFRPLIGWATAWSFDRLRLWIERDLPPERAAGASLARAGAGAGCALLAGAALRAGLHTPERARVGFGLAALAAGVAAGLASGLGARDVPLARRCRRHRPKGTP